MAGRHTKLTQEVQETICVYIRSGAYDWVAAEAAGISSSTFYRWMQEGERRSSGKYRDFYEAVRQARAQARVAAEIEVRREQPARWLTKGPGRDRPGEPGWGDRPLPDDAPDGSIVITFDLRRASPEYDHDG